VNILIISSFVNYGYGNSFIRDWIPALKSEILFCKGARIEVPVMSWIGLLVFSLVLYLGAWGGNWLRGGIVKVSCGFEVIFFLNWLYVWISNKAFVDNNIFNWGVGNNDHVLVKRNLGWGCRSGWGVGREVRYFFNLNIIRLSIDEIIWGCYWCL
jgi:hypothetical protein